MKIHACSRSDAQIDQDAHADDQIPVIQPRPIEASAEVNERTTALLASITPEDQTVYDLAIHLLERFDDSYLSGGMVVRPLATQALRERTVGGTSLPQAMLNVMALCHRDPWLNDRMTFHGLADIQEWSHGCSVVATPPLTSAQRDSLTRAALLGAHYDRSIHHDLLGDSDRNRFAFASRLCDDGLITITTHDGMPDITPIGHRWLADHPGSVLDAAAVYVIRTTGIQQAPHEAMHTLHRRDPDMASYLIRIHHRACSEST